MIVGDGLHDGGVHIGQTQTTVLRVLVCHGIEVLGSAGLLCHLVANIERIKLLVGEARDVRCRNGCDEREDGLATRKLLTAFMISCLFIVVMMCYRC